MKQPEWTPFQEATLPPMHVKEKELIYGSTDVRCYLNSLYQVNVIEIPSPYPKDSGWPQDPILQLSIKRRDKLAIHDWRHLQKIKNEIVGPERLAVEFYPPESMLVDTANQYFLWVLPPAFGPNLFPFMFKERAVVEGSMGGSRQRPWSKEDRPKDVMSGEEADRRIAEHRRKVMGDEEER